MTIFSLTIGPIYETMKKARKTRDLWASSYMFSYIIRKIATKIRDEVGEINFLMPHLGPAPKNGAGLYPDRIMAIIPTSTGFNNLNAIVEKEIDEFASLVAIHLEENVDLVKKYFNSYIRCATKETLVPPNGNINLTVYPQLDQLELTPKIPLADRDYTSLFINKVNGSFLVGDGYDSSAFFKNIKDTIRFESTLEVSAKSLEYLHKVDFDKIVEKYILIKGEHENDILTEFKNKFGNDFRPHQKYIAIVNADGDGIGETIKQIAKVPQKIKAFSKFLYDFASKATDEVKEYGGLPIYMGGDDMLFFAPVAVKKENSFLTIFDLCNSLDRLFNEEYQKLKTNLNLELELPTISFGVSVTYYKYPLYESLIISHENLWLKAKTEDKYGKKNKISFSLQKHSGQLIETTFEKNKAIYGSINIFYSKWINITGDSSEFLNSLTYKLEHLAPLLEAATEQGISLDTFFKNQFNEDVHLSKIKNGNESFIESLANLTSEIYESESDINLLYTSLRFIHFINSKNDNR